MPDEKFEEITAKVELLRLPAQDLLAKFGSGGHKPGSGSAAALLGLVACKLVQTVVSLSDGRDKYADVQPQLTLANQRITQEIEPFLLKAVEEDSHLFDRVIAARRAREQEKDSKKKKLLSDRALSELRAATELPLEIAQHCLDLADRALVTYDLGFKSARGDSGVALSAAISAAQGAIFIVFLNLTSFRGSEWAGRTRVRAEELQQRANVLNVSLFERMASLHEEASKRNEVAEEVKADAGG